MSYPARIASLSCRGIRVRPTALRRAQGEPTPGSRQPHGFAIFGFGVDVSPSAGLGIAMGARMSDSLDRTSDLHFKVGDVRPIQLTPTRLRSGRVVVIDQEERDEALVQFEDFSSKWVRFDHVG
jgi:hypothetical protein